MGSGHGGGEREEHGRQIKHIVTLTCMRAAASRVLCTPQNGNRIAIHKQHGCERHRNPCGVNHMLAWSVKRAIADQFLCRKSIPGTRSRVQRYGRHLPFCSWGVQYSGQHALMPMLRGGCSGKGAQKRHFWPPLAPLGLHCSCQWSTTLVKEPLATCLSAWHSTPSYLLHHWPYMLGCSVTLSF
jgi:hypothetical protein